ncbi:hypothetical protein AAZX31_20G116000 [Glycine max]|uniref:Uncharacterized protein n=1 Tax=Glycine soja TaxID=3848 RepID=A0A445F486_GLYSO|nr:hypothetical protein GLYMA_20G128251v4 [Glycine max]KAH1035831.1 hypothetical protein GYH30_055688 [Glycine max]KAH1190789.1 hypothetical protein GmHk_20G058239 [Glycine max]RZB43661.1 hypothetical protein D0Y65_053951 [Glycine soja]
MAAGKLQSFAFIVIILSFSSWVKIQHGMARPLNTLVLHRDADQEPIRRAILESSHTVVRSSKINVGDIDAQKNTIRKLVVDNSGPSPDGPGHKGLLTSYSQLNN